MNAIQFKIKNFFAIKSGIPNTFNGIIRNETPKAIYIEGHGVAKASVNCMKCGRALTHPVSRLAGIGPECGQHFHIPAAALKKDKLDEADFRALEEMMMKVKIRNWIPKSVILNKEQIQDDRIQQPKKEEKQEQPKLTAKKSENGLRINLHFPYNQKTITKVKSISGRKYHPDGKFWSIPYNPSTFSFLEKIGFSLDKSLTEKKKKKSSIKWGTLPFPLLPFQKPGVEFIQEHSGRALIADEMGLGKTIQALAWLRLNPDMRPVVIVCPNSLKLNWLREAKKWLDLKRDRICVVYGNKDNGKFQCVGNDKTDKANIIIINYDVLTSWKDYIVKSFQPEAIIADEIHYAKNYKAQRTKALYSICKGKKVVGLTGTPIENRPIEIYTPTNIISPGLFTNKMEFALRYCNAKHNGYGWDFSGCSNTEELHKILTETFMLRRKKSDVLKDLPEKIRTVCPIDISNKKEYSKASNAFLQWLLEEKGMEKVAKAKRAEALTKLNGLLQLSAKGKIKETVEWINNFLETEDKLIVFCRHKKVLSSLMQKLEKYNPVKIEGQDTPIARQKAIDDFQNDKSVRLFIGNTQAAGVGITLTASSAVLFVELGLKPGEHRQAEDRAHRIGQKSTVNIYYLIAQHTIEERIMELLDRKQIVLDQIIDGRETEDVDLLTELLDQYKEK